MNDFDKELARIDAAQRGDPWILTLAAFIAALAAIIARLPELIAAFR